MKFHPPPDRVERLGRFFAEWTEEERRTLLHSFDCADCAALLRPLLVPAALHRPPAERLAKVLHLRPAERPADQQYEAALEASLQSQVERRAFYERQRQEAPSLLLELLTLPRERAEALLRGAPRFHSWGLLELLVETGRDAIDPARTEDLAALGLALTEHLDPELHGAARIEDLRSRAWAVLADSRRLRGDLAGAALGFDQSYRCFLYGSRENFERAIYLDLRAGLHREEGRLGSAVQSSRRAYGIFRELDEPQRAGRALARLALALHAAGRRGEAIDHLYGFLAEIDPQREPRLRLVLVDRLLEDLTAAGRYLEARELYQGVHKLYEAFPDANLLAHARWMRGRILRGIGQSSLETELLWQSARDSYLAHGNGYDAARVSAELALSFAEAGAAASLAGLAPQLLAVAGARGLHPRARTAVLTLRETLAFHATVAENPQTPSPADLAGIAALARHVVAYLELAQDQPSLTFTPRR